MYEWSHGLISRDLNSSRALVGALTFETETLLDDPTRVGCYVDVSLERHTMRVVCSFEPARQCREIISKIKSPARDILHHSLAPVKPTITSTSL